MPIATRMQETVRHDLKSCDKGFVELRQLSYDEMLERRDGAMQVLMGDRGRNETNPQMAIKIANKWSNYFTFARCIVSHNLTNADGVPLDFTRPEIVFPFLDPKVGAELESLIDELNQEVDENDDFTIASRSSSPSEESTPSNGTEPT